MARGLPAVWSALLALPFLGTGAYVSAFRTEFTVLGRQARAPPSAGLALLSFGLFVVGLGLYVQYVAAPAAPTLRDGERVVDDRDPAQRNALGQAVASFPFLGAGVYLLYFTDEGYVYPIAALAVGFYLFSTGSYRYWQNTLRTYVVTNRRVIDEYRFLSLVRSELPLEKVRGVEERRSAWDSMFGLGNVHVRAGGGGDLTVTVASVYEPGAFADAIRAQLDDYGGGPSEDDGGSNADESGDGPEDADAVAVSAGRGTAADSTADSETDGTRSVADPHADDSTDTGSFEE